MYGLNCLSPLEWISDLRSLVQLSRYQFLKCDAGVVSAISMIERFHALTMALHTASRRSKTTWKQHKAMIK